MAPKPIINSQLPSGIEIHGNSLRISFYYNFTRYKETLGLPPTKQNIKYAQGLRETVIYEIKTGTFNYAHRFPNSKHAIGKFTNGKLGEMGKEFLEYKSHNIRRSSLERMSIALRGFFDFHGAKRSIETLTPRSLTQYKNDLVIGRNGKTINNHLTTVNSFLKWLYKMGYLLQDLSQILEKVKQAPSDINPFSFEEIETALACCRVLQHKTMITLAVYTGLRTGELTTLAWEDVDLENGTLHIRRSAYKDRGLKTTKTDEERFVDLPPPAIEALRAQSELTHSMPAKEYEVELPDKSFKNESLHFVFNPKAVRAQKGSDYDYYGHRAIIRIWQSLCNDAGIKYRNPYQLRHTFASWMITHGHVNISYLAQQMGHSDITMIAKIYGKWLKEANKKESERTWKEIKKAQDEAKLKG
ncbi:site-specific integrase [Vibrio alginolyticus]|nr:site-specific integrase [Vibrio alginolyticus]